MSDERRFVYIARISKRGRIERVKVGRTRNPLRREIALRSDLGGFRYGDLRMFYVAPVPAGVASAIECELIHMMVESYTREGTTEVFRCRACDAVAVLHEAMSAVERQGGKITPEKVWRPDYAEERHARHWWHGPFRRADAVAAINARSSGRVSVAQLNRRLGPRGEPRAWINARPEGEE